MLMFNIVNTLVEVVSLCTVYEHPTPREYSTWTVTWTVREERE
jgi:hypothetical protein